MIDKGVSSTATATPGLLIMTLNVFTETYLFLNIKIFVLNCTRVVKIVPKLS